VAQEEGEVIPSMQQLREGREGWREGGREKIWKNKHDKS